jgi:hypothetical protein
MAAAASHETEHISNIQATIPRAQYEDWPMTSEALANVRSLILDHIANITAAVAEEYLRDSLSPGMGTILVSVMAPVPGRKS